MPACDVNIPTTPNIFSTIDFGEICDISLSFKFIALDADNGNSSLVGWHEIENAFHHLWICDFGKITQPLTCKAFDQRLPTSYWNVARNAKINSPKNISIQWMCQCFAGISPWHSEKSEKWIIRWTIAMFYPFRKNTFEDFGKIIRNYQRIRSEKGQTKIYLENEMIRRQK